MACVHWYRTYEATFKARVSVDLRVISSSHSVIARIGNVQDLVLKPDQPSYITSETVYLGFITVLPITQESAFHDAHRFTRH
jgi:hypothetical protein